MMILEMSSNTSSRTSKDLCEQAYKPDGQVVRCIDMEKDVYIYDLWDVTGGTSYCGWLVV